MLKDKNKLQREADAQIKLSNGVELSIYDFSTENNERFTCKFTLADSFIIYGRVIVNRKKKNAFISYPSYYDKTAEKYVNQAYCFDKDIISEINNFLDDTFFN